MSGLITFLTTFLSCFVESVEALTIVLAVALTRGWRSAFAGVAVAAVILGLIVGIGGPALETIPIAVIQLVLGGIILVVGIRWLKKAVLRAAGQIPLRDEDAAFERTELRLNAATQRRMAFQLDREGVMTAFNAVLVEGIEVVMIVVAVGATQHQWTIGLAAATSAVGIVLVLGYIVHRPLSLVPDNWLKLAVGIMLSSLGTFWTVEGLRFEWPHGDLDLILLIAVYAAIAAAGAFGLRRKAA